MPDFIIALSQANMKWKIMFKSANWGKKNTTQNVWREQAPPHACRGKQFSDPSPRLCVPHTNTLPNMAEMQLYPWHCLLYHNEQNWQVSGHSCEQHPQPFHAATWKIRREMCANQKWSPRATTKSHSLVTTYCMAHNAWKQGSPPYCECNHNQFSSSKARAMQLWGCNNKGIRIPSLWWGICDCVELPDTACAPLLKSWLGLHILAYTSVPSTAHKEAVMKELTVVVSV